MTFFRSPSEFRAWLKRHHRGMPELWVGFYKKDSGERSITYPEALDEALCFGWIDGVRKRVDELSYTIRFTPRKAQSIWSRVNIRRAKQLKALGRMTVAGLKAFAARTPQNRDSFERSAARLWGMYERQFRKDKAAWTFFQAQPPGYRRTAIFWVTSAKKEETRLRRLAQLIQDSQSGRRLAIIAGTSSR